MASVAMNPALPHQIERALVRRIGRQFKLYPVVARHSLILAAPERIKKIAIQIVNNARHVVTVVVHRP